MTSSREGDNAQVLAVAEALGVPFEIRRFRNRPGAIAVNLIAGTRASTSLVVPLNPIAPPWPDLVIAAGTQSEPILTQLRAVAPHAKQVFLGRPWRSPDRYDLVVTTPQYRVPASPNVLELDLPLHRVGAAAIAREAARWQTRLAHLPRPWTVVLLGGSINRYTLDRRAVRRIAMEAGERAALQGGSLLICSSYRTPAAAMPALAKALSVPAFIFDWRRAPRAENPYLAFLGLGDEIIVTGDSISMLAEACATGKPVYIFDLGEGRYAMRPDAPAAPSMPAGSAIRAWLKDLKVRATNRLLPERLHRDTRPIHRRLVESGRAAWLGDALPAALGPALRNDATVVAARILIVMQAGAPGASETALARL
jgi:mitochondrial fission protein ELM1